MKTIKDYNLESMQSYPLKKKIVNCEMCYGLGKIHMYDRDDLILFFRKNDYSYHKAMRIYREWKECKTVECPECESQGNWEIYY